MALLIGQETESASTTLASIVEIAHAFKFKALKTGKVEALHIKFNETGTGTKGRIALQENEAGKPKEGVLAEAEITSIAAGEHEAAVTATEVVEGTEYWLTFESLGGTAKYKQGTTAVRRLAGTKHAKISEVTAAQWEAEVTKGPISIWGTGTESGATLTAQCKTKVTLVGKEAPTQQSQPQASTRVIIGDSAAVRMAAEAQEKARLTLKDTATAGFQARVGATASFQFADHASVVVTNQAQAIAKLTFTDAATANAVMQARATAKFVIADKASARQIQQAVGKAKVVFGGEATAKAKTGEARKIVLMIFED